MGNSKEGTVWSLDVGKLNSANTKLWNTLGGRGAQIIEQLDSDEKFRQRVADCMSREGFGAPIPYNVARFILGDNMVGGIEELHDIFFGLRLKRGQETIEMFPWGTDVLFSPCPFFKGKFIYETHVAFLGLDKIKGEKSNIANFLKFFPATSKPSFHPSSYDESDYQKTFSKYSGRRPEFFTDTTLGFRWYLMSKNNIPNFTYYASDATNGQYSEDKLPHGYEIPTAIENIAKYFFVSKKQKKLLTFPDTLCSDNAAKNNASNGQGTVYVKDDDGKGIWVGWVVEDWLDHLQLTVSRKPPVL